MTMPIEKRVVSKKPTYDDPDRGEVIPNPLQEGNAQLDEHAMAIASRLLDTRESIDGRGSE